MNHPLDPIAAIVTAPGRGAVGIVRVSGKHLMPLVQAVCGQTLVPRQATYLPFKDAGGQPIDQGLAIFFPAPHSYTGEDVLELQGHGGPVVLRLLLERCLQADARVRPARPGEFTERAFWNDKIDLAQAEAIADLIDASTEAAARSAVRSLAGEFSTQVNQLKDALIHLRMLVEATLDFPEEDIDFVRAADVQGQLLNLQKILNELSARAQQGAILREGIKVVIAGQPNAGKSSLLNALAGHELAIVTPIAGTTRDKISQLIQIDGVPLHVVDTAGLRATQDEVEKIGVERAWAEIESADAVLFLHDLIQYAQAEQSLPPLSEGGDVEREELAATNYIAQDQELAGAIAKKLPKNTQVIDVWNKADQVPASNKAGIHISAKTGAGLDQLRQKLLEVVGWQAAPEGVFMARARHVQALAKAAQSLEQTIEQASSPNPALDLLAEDLRQTHNALSEITGQFTPDDLLGEIFSKFCIGK